MKESDWKQFKKIKENALEAFCEKTLEEVSLVINDKSERSHDRYLHIYRLLRDHDKQLERLFDGQSRSRARMQLIAIRAESLADESLLKELTPEFLEQTDPEKSGW